MHLIAIDLGDRDGELVADRCWQAGASGLWEVDERTVRAGVEPAQLERFLDAVADLDPVDVTDAEAVELAGRSATVPFAGQVIGLWVPATVFGDGRHPTTAACLDLLSAVVGPGTTVLDVGSGAGALSIGAALLGGRVTAIDVDDTAREATAANARRNGVAIETSPASLADVASSFDVVCANLTVGSLAPLVPDLVRVTRPGGTAILSGMLVDQWSRIRAAVGGQLVEERVVDGWITAAIRRT